MVLATVVVTVLSGPSPAAAAVGDLSVGQVISHGVAGTTEIGAPNPLETAAATAVSPDGTSVYVVSSGHGDYTGAAVSHFRRAADGSLSFAGCIGSSAPCRTLPGLLNGAVRVVARASVVYVGTLWGVVVFARATNGDLRYLSCIADSSGHGCGAVYPDLRNPGDLAVTANGRNVYLLTTNATPTSAVQIFQVDPVSGAWGYGGCVGEAYPGCTPTVARGVLTLPGALVLSSDDASLYVLDEYPGSVLHLRRDPGSGALREAGCVGYDNPSLARRISGCATVPVDTFAGRALAVTRAGDSLYVGAFGGVAHLRRDPATGNLWFAGCVGRATGCTQAGPAVSIRELVATDDGRGVYALTSSDGVVHYRRSTTTGDVAYAGCIGGTDRLWCTTVPIPGTIDDGSFGLAAAPDGRSLYVTDDAGSLTHLVRQLS